MGIMTSKTNSTVFRLEKASNQNIKVLPCCFRIEETKPDMVVHNHNLRTWGWDKVIPSSRSAWAIKQDYLKKIKKKSQNEKHVSNMSCRWYFQMQSYRGHNSHSILCFPQAWTAFASLHAVRQRDYNTNISWKIWISGWQQKVPNT